MWGNDSDWYKDVMLFNSYCLPYKAWVLNPYPYHTVFQDVTKAAAPRCPEELMISFKLFILKARNWKKKNPSVQRYFFFSKLKELVLKIKQQSEWQWQGQALGCVDWHCNTVLFLLMVLNCHDLSDMEIEALIWSFRNVNIIKLWDKLIFKVLKL